MRDDQVRDYKLDEHDERLAALEAAVFGANVRAANSQLIDEAIEWCALQMETLQDENYARAIGFLNAMAGCISYLSRLKLRISGE